MELRDIELIYVGPKSGRIMQVHHDGRRLVMQYSPLMNFKGEGAVENVRHFIRYQVSRPGIATTQSIITTAS